MAVEPTIAVPAGLDVMTPDEQRLMDSMRADDPGAPAAPEPPTRKTVQKTKEAAPEPPEPALDAEVDLDAGSEPDAPTDHRVKMVPHAQFHAANERRKAAEVKAQEAAVKLAAVEARTEERLSMLAAAVQASAPAPAAAVDEISIPDVNVDPVGHFQAELARRDRKIQDLEAMQRGFTEGQQQQRQIAELRNWSAEQERAFQAKEPTYPEAMRFLEESRHAELEQIGIMDAAERRRIIGTDIFNIAQRARQEGADFADRLYKVATARGYKKATAAVPALDAALQEPDLDAVEATATRQAAARDSSTTIGSIGSAPPTRLSAEKISNMSERDFSVLLKRMEGNPAALRELMGN